MIKHLEEFIHLTILPYFSLIKDTQLIHFKEVNLPSNCRHRRCRQKLNCGKLGHYCHLSSMRGKVCRLLSHGDAQKL